MKAFFRQIGNFFRYIGKALSLIRNTILNTLIILLLIFLTYSFLTSSKELIIKNRSALVLSISGDIVEEKETIDPFSNAADELFGLKDLPHETLLQDVLDAIHRAGTDPRISCIVLKLDEMGRAGINQLQVIGKELDRFKSTGKKVIAAADTYSQKQYYLASYADTVILNPMGSVDLHGFGVYRHFFKDALDKLHITMHVFRVGKYKSAVEPLIENSMSPESKSQDGIWLSSLWRIFTADICKNRSLPTGSVDSFINNMPARLSETGGDTAVLAQKTGFVDFLKTRKELLDFLMRMTAPDSDSEFRQVSFKDYLKTFTPSYQGGRNSPNRIGIIVAEGNILNGDQPSGEIGGDSLAALIRKARTDEHVKALVLRINSGGGSVFASEIIRQELIAFKKSGKPYVVSMSSVAASGGYWIAADADEIWASATTITGSIGIFGAFPTFENTLDNLGIHHDGVGTTKISSGMDLTQPLPPLLEETIRLSVERGYKMFLSIVEQGRKLDSTKMDSIAEGRVFDAVTAQKIGLVDKLGTLQDAIISAAHMAGVKDYAAQYIQKPVSIKNKLIQHLTIHIASIVRSNIVPAEIADKIANITPPLRRTLQFNDPKGLYAHWMTDFD